jgi:hypothetical protein
MNKTTELKNSPLFYITDQQSLAGDDTLTHAWHDAAGTTHALI